MKTVNHPGIVSLIDTHSTYRGLHIVMDYAERQGVVCSVCVDGKTVPLVVIFFSLVLQGEFVCVPS
jgi:hypothetical protein